jgi:hypothetical protein
LIVRLARRAKLQVYIALALSKAQTRLLSRPEYFPEDSAAIAASSLIGQGRIAERPAKQLVAVLGAGWPADFFLLTV